MYNNCQTRNTYLEALFDEVIRNRRWSTNCWPLGDTANAGAARIPADWPASSLKTIDPTKGWLTDPSIKPVGKHNAARYSDYAGDKSKAMWHFDKEIADATTAFLQGVERKDQFISWKDPHYVSAGARNFLTTIRWVGDGQTFAVHPFYADEYPGLFKGRGSKWAQAGEPVGRSSAPLRVKPVSGPLVRVGDFTLRFQYDELAPATENSRATFMAFSEGDDLYRYTERVGMVDGKLLRIEIGKTQAITFPPVGDLKADSGTMKLKASS
ncbi:MAG: hypothetical protein N2C14_04970, partial [Planctomycetales bacterium]